MRPSQVIDAHVDLLTRWEVPLFRQGVTSIIAAEVATDNGFESGGGEGLEFMRQVSELFAESMEATTRASYCYKVTDDMTDLVLFAAAGLNDEDTWDRNLAPTGCGLVRFDKPVPLGFVRPDTGEELPVTADWALWGPGPPREDEIPRTHVYWFSDVMEGGGTQSPFGRWFAKQPYASKARQVQGRWMLIGWDSFPQGWVIGPPMVSGTGVEVGKGGSGGYAAVTLASSDIEMSTSEQVNSGRIMHALWLMLEQTVTVLREEPIERPARRRAERMKIPARVTTVALRRAEYHGPRPDGESQIEWQHRWIVRGHWRWQVCGPHHPHAQEVGPGTYRARIWIHPFVKGPEGAPFAQSAKVYSLER